MRLIPWLISITTPIDTINMPAWLHSDSQEIKDYETVTSTPKHEAHFSHELIASAAAGFAAHEIQKKHAHDTGEPSKHAMLIDTASALAAGFAVKFAEGKGHDLVDKYKRDAANKTKETIHVSEHEEWKDVNVTENFS